MSSPLRITVSDALAARIKLESEDEGTTESIVCSVLLREAYAARDRRSDAFERPSAPRKPLSKGEH